MTTIVVEFKQWKYRFSIVEIVVFLLALANET